MPSAASYPSSLPTPGTTPGFSALDGPPPSPAVEGGMSTGASPSNPPLGSMVPMGAGMASTALPPEVLTGAVQAGESMVKTLDAFAQMMPDLGPDILMAKDALMRVLARMVQSGAGPTSPQAPGPNFPGGGFESGGFAAP
jgi:hypothetical protein